MPEGLVHVGCEWFFEEFAKGGVTSLGLGDKGDEKSALPAGEEKRKILDLFRN